MIFLAGAVVAVLILAIITFFHIWPGQLLNFGTWLSRLRLGMVVRYSYCGSYRFCYTTRGKQGGATLSVLMLHGFTSTKDTWLPVIKNFPKSQHVVCVDLPAHGGTSCTGPKDYTFLGQVQRVHQFVQSIGLNKRPFHLVGYSMGGICAGVYAAQYPNDLYTLTLICPGGVVSDTETEFTSYLKKVERREHVESNPLIPTTVKELQNVMKTLVVKYPKLSPLVWQGLFDNFVAKIDIYKQVLKVVAEDSSSHKLQDNLHLITAPLQVIWGKEDKLVPVSGVEVLQAALPHCRLDLLDHCGHNVMMDAPEKATKLLIDFVCAQKVNGENGKKLS